MAVSSSRNRKNGNVSNKKSHSDDSTGQVEADALAAVSDVDNFDLSALQAALHPALEELPRVPQQARSREKRAELLKAAEALFIERGYASTTADDIATAAGVSVGTFYNYFRNKRQILLAMALLRLSDIFTHLRLTQMDLAHGDRRLAIRDAITSIVASGRQQGLRGVWQQLMSLEPELAPYQTIVRRYAINMIEERLNAAREQGGVWPDLDIPGTSLAIYSLLDNISSRREDDLPEDRIIESISMLIERSLFVPYYFDTDSTADTGQETRGAP